MKSRAGSGRKRERTITLAISNCQGQPPYRVGETLEEFAPWIFGLSAFASLFVIVRCNVMSAKIWKDIDRIARGEGREWLPWSDRGQHMRFVFAPSKLLSVAKLREGKDIT